MTNPVTQLRRSNDNRSNDNGGGFAAADLSQPRRAGYEAAPPASRGRYGDRCATAYGRP